MILMTEEPISASILNVGESKKVRFSEKSPLKNLENDAL